MRVSSTRITWMRTSTFGAAALLCAVMASPGAEADTVLFVDDDAPPGGDGLTWETAYRFPKDGLTASRQAAAHPWSKRT